MFRADIHSMSGKNENWHIVDGLGSSTVRTTIRNDTVNIDVSNMIIGDRIATYIKLAKVIVIYQIVKLIVLINEVIS